MEGTFSGTAHYNQSELRQALLDYKNTGEDVYFEMQITNDDPDSAAGRQTIVFYDCNMDGDTLPSSMQTANIWMKTSTAPSRISPCRKPLPS